MNACGARLELGYGRPIMSSLHAGYSIAGLGGAGIGGVSAWLGASPLATFAVDGRRADRPRPAGRARTCSSPPSRPAEPTHPGDPPPPSHPARSPR